MTKTPSTARVIFAGAATIATLSLFTAPLAQAAPSTGSGGRVVTVDDGGVNDNGQTSGDIFTQNAQDQSTA
jgi:hypothetical protein